MKPTILLAAVLALVCTADAQARTVCITGADGQQRCYQVDDAPLGVPTPAATPARFASHTAAPAAAGCTACASCESGEAEHSIVHRRRPIRNALRGVFRVASSPFRWAARGVRSRRGCCH